MALLNHSRLLRSNGIRVVTKPHRPLQQEFPSPKFRPPIDLQTNVVYIVLIALGITSVKRVDVC